MARYTSSGHDGSVLAASRKRLKLTQSELAEHFGVHRGTIIEWEKGTAPTWTRFAMMGLAAIIVSSV